ncbi:unannotated protein [freshwater metagenome]|uniref:Unannotated protein n=1 Tax=freshwater metagenome TaxID=449393 RepID=A0A6J6MBC8_9ZZZZ
MQINETTEPARIGPIRCEYSGARSSGNFFTEAPRITGRANKKAKSEAVAWDKPRSKPELIVIPNLLIPAKSANDCPRPIVRAMRGVTFSVIWRSSARSVLDPKLRCENFSAQIRITPLMVRKAAAANGFANKLLILCSKAKANKMTGRVAHTINQNTRPWVEGRLRNVFTPPPMRPSHLLRKTQKRARALAKCNAIVTVR